MGGSTSRLRLDVVVSLCFEAKIATRRIQRADLLPLFYCYRRHASELQSLLVELSDQRISSLSILQGAQNGQTSGFDLQAFVLHSASVL